MDTSARINVLVLLVVLSFCSRTVARGEVAEVKQDGSVSNRAAHVSIENRLGNGRSLRVHCKSKDDDLGEHNLGDGGEYSWSFSPNFFGTTLFFCDLGWENVENFHFDAFSYGRDWVKCGHHCSWIVAQEGIYGWNGSTGSWEFMYHWP